jgi:splicing factor U2AF subunit
MVSTIVKDTPTKVFLGGIPQNWSEQRVKELLKEKGGTLKSFYMVRDDNTGFPKGFAYCEFVSLESVKRAIQQIDGM